MRICSGDYLVWDSLKNRSERVHFEQGEFHEWGVESTVYREGVAVDSIALVELSGGKIVNAISDSVVFNDYARSKIKELWEYAPLQ